VQRKNHVLNLKLEENYIHFWRTRADVFSYFKKLEVGQLFPKIYTLKAAYEKLKALKENQRWLKKQKTRTVFFWIQVLIFSAALPGREVLNAIEAAEKVGSSIVFADITDLVICPPFYISLLPLPAFPSPHFSPLRRPVFSSSRCLTQPDPTRLDRCGSKDRPEVQGQGHQRNKSL
jgi:hypothetical protein